MTGSQTRFDQTVSVVVKRKPIKCSGCGEWRTQFERCENCGCEISYEDERKKNETV